MPTELRLLSTQRENVNQQTWHILKMLIRNVWVKCSLTRNFFCFSTKTVNLALSSHSDDITVMLFLWSCLGAAGTWLRLGTEHDPSNAERLSRDSRRSRVFNKHLKNIFFQPSPEESNKS